MGFLSFFMALLRGPYPLFKAFVRGLSCSMVFVKGCFFCFN